MSEEENKAVIRRWIEAYNERDLEAEADVLAPGFVAHVPDAPSPPGLGGLLDRGVRRREGAKWDIRKPTALSYEGLW